MYRISIDSTILDVFPKIGFYWFWWQIESIIYFIFLRGYVLNQSYVSVCLCLCVIFCSIFRETTRFTVTAGWCHLQRKEVRIHDKFLSHSMKLKYRNHVSGYWTSFCIDMILTKLAKVWKWASSCCCLRLHSFRDLRKCLSVCLSVCLSLFYFGEVENSKASPLHTHMHRRVSSKSLRDHFLLLLLFFVVVCCLLFFTYSDYDFIAVVVFYAVLFPCVFFFFLFLLVLYKGLRICGTKFHPLFLSSAVLKQFMFSNSINYSMNTNDNAKLEHFQRTPPKYT